MWKRYFFLFIVSVIAFGAFADTYNITRSQQKIMTEEAEDWMDDMPDGIQDRLSDAVNHSLRGFFGELEYFRNIADTTGIGKYKVTVKNFQGGKNSNIPMRIYKGISVAKDKILPLLIYFHGGGWTMGSIETSDRFCRALASEGNVIVVSVSYPLAPEYAYPSGIEICVGAVEFIETKAKEWGSDKSLISLGGDGAGGNIALSVLQKLPDSNKIRSMVLYYPLLHASGELDTSLKQKYGRGYGFDSRLWEAYVNAYKGENLQISKVLPPVLLISAGRDIIINEEKNFSSSQKGVTYIEFEGALHGFISDNHQNTAFNLAVNLTNKFLQTK